MTLSVAWKLVPTLFGFCSSLPEVSFSVCSNRHCLVNDVRFDGHTQLMRCSTASCPHHGILAFDRGRGKQERFCRQEIQEISGSCPRVKIDFVSSNGARIETRDEWENASCHHIGDRTLTPFVHLTRGGPRLPFSSGQLGSSLV